MTVTNWAVVAGTIIGLALEPLSRPRTTGELLGVWLVIQDSRLGGITEIEVRAKADGGTDPDYTADETGCRFEWEAGLLRHFPWNSLHELRWTPKP